MALDLAGIHNGGEFYSHHYLEAVLGNDLADVLKEWKNREKEEGLPTPQKRLNRLAGDYFKARHEASLERSLEGRWRLARDFHARVLEALGYRYEPAVEPIEGDLWVPVLLSEKRDGRPFLWVVDGPFTIEEDESALDESPLPEQLPRGAEESQLPELSWRELFDGPLFRREHPPRWVIFMGGDEIVLVDRYKWGQGKFLQFSLGPLFSRRQAKALQATAALLHKEVLNPEDGVCVHDILDENAHKHAYAVSTDLKYGAREAIELLGNEAVRYKREVAKEAVFSNEELAAQLTAECLIYLYRLLFLFYVEARGEELGVAPMKSEAFRQGYSLESLRDLELVPLTTTEVQEGTYIHQSLETLFRLVQQGFPFQRDRRSIAGQLALDFEQNLTHEGFTMRGLSSPLFDPDRTPMLRGVKFRNRVLQRVLQLLSLSREGKRKERGRISYAQLGINQLGSVYEGLLSYTGFFAHEDLYEVRAANEVSNPEARTFFVPESEAGAFSENEFVCTGKGKKIVHPKGTYLFRLSGREREKSASFYTPEVLTRCLVKYTLRERLKDLGADGILELTVCEPAMGSGAFLNETISQLADAYLERKQEELGEALPSGHYPREKQLVKYHFAAHNCYGVDKNPRALELARLSLWLGVLTPDVETPYLDLRLATGDSLIGAKAATYHRADLVRKNSQKNPNWLGKVPDRVNKEGRSRGSVYHFLVPYDGMASFEKDKAVKKLEKENLDRMKAWRKEICQPFTPAECDSLERISGRIDELWRAHTAERRSTLKQLRQPVPIWGQPEPAGEPLTMAQSRQVAARLERGTAAGRRLAAVMDYWCALWFWPIQQAELLPTRDEWLLEVEALLDGDVDSLMTGLERFQVVRDVTRKTRFVHWELVFAEVFADRGGFDVIVGNPPWVKVEWQEAGVLGDIAPELVVKGLSAKQVADRRPEVLSDDGERALYLGEYQEMIGTAQFLNAGANYPLLVGVQTNLYKCFLVHNWELLSRAGVQGLVHQPGLLDDPKGGHLRNELSRRLRRAALFKNELVLFEGVHHLRPYCLTVTAGSTTTVSFKLCGNLLHPRTLEESEVHDGHGAVPGIKTEEGNWDLRGHRSRIIEVDEETLGLFARLYDKPGTPALEARLPVVHSREILNVLRRFGEVDRRLGDLGDDYYSTECFHETNQQKDGTIKRETRFPRDVSEWIVSGPHFYVATPFNKTPNEGCRHNQDYTVIDHTEMPDDYLPRTNYVPACEPEEFRRRIPRWRGRALGEFFRHMHRKMLAPTGERTLVSCLMPREATSIITAIQTAFIKLEKMILFAGFTCSIPLDFFVKSTGKA